MRERGCVVTLVMYYFNLLFGGMIVLICMMNRWAPEGEAILWGAGEDNTWNMAFGAFMLANATLLRVWSNEERREK